MSEEEKKTGELYIRNVIFGICDSLVSTVGLLSGINAAGTPKSAIIMTGIVYTFVEAFSMSVGSFLSEESVEEFDADGAVDGKGSFKGGVIMFVSFILASFVPIVPYMLFDISTGLWVSIVLSILTLFIAGLVSGKYAKVGIGKHAAKMALLGGAAILIGVIAGKFFKEF